MEHHLQQYREQSKKFFNQRKSQLLKKPIEADECGGCSSGVCAGVGVILLLGLIGVGAAQMAETRHFGSYDYIVFSCLFLPLLFCFFFIAMWQCCWDSCLGCCVGCCMGTLEFLVSASIFGLLIIAFAISIKVDWESGVVWFILCFIYSLFICYNYASILEGVNLFKAVAFYFTSRKATLVLMLMMGLVGVFLGVVWVRAFLGEEEGILKVVLAILLLHLTAFLHYAGCFLGSKIFTYWFYDRESSFCRCQWMRFFFAICQFSVAAPFYFFFRLLHAIDDMIESKVCYGCLSKFLANFDQHLLFAIKTKHMNSSCLIMAAVSGCTVEDTLKIIEHLRKKEQAEKDKKEQEEKDKKEQAEKDKKEQAEKDKQMMILWDVQKHAYIWRIILGVVLGGWSFLFMFIAMYDTNPNEDKKSVVDGGVGLLVLMGAIGNGMMQVLLCSITTEYMLEFCDYRVTEDKEGSAAENLNEVVKVERIEKYHQEWRSAFTNAHIIVPKFQHEKLLLIQARITSQQSQQINKQNQPRQQGQQQNQDNDRQLGLEPSISPENQSVVQLNNQENNIEQVEDDRQDMKQQKKKDKDRRKINDGY